jgi:hypothetical protein
LAVGTASELSDEEQFEFPGDPVQTQAAPAAFGVARRFLLINRCAGDTKVTWWWNPEKDRPSKWERPSPVFSSR